MANTPVLDLEPQSTADKPASAYYARVEEDTTTNNNDAKVDAFAGKLTASFKEKFFISGTINDKLGQFYGGPSYNDGGPRIITKVLAFARNSGSGGVTRVDVRKSTNGVPNSSNTIFSNNVFKCILSASAGAGVIASTTTIVAASATWAPGEFIVPVIEAAAGAAAGGTATDFSTDLVVLIKWKQSGSYA